MTDTRLIPTRAAVAGAGRSTASYVARSGRRGVAVVVTLAVLATLLVVLWPGGETRELARSGDHGPPVRWLAAAMG